MPVSLTRAIKFAVDFEDIKRFSPAWKTWNKVLHAVEDDLRHAANRGLEALYLMHRGAILRPTKADGKPVSVRTLTYQVFSGAWLPFGEEHGPLYQPKAAARISSRVLLAASGILNTRAATDFKSVERGEVRLPVFRRMSIPFLAAGISIDPTSLAISHPLWAKGVEGESLPRLIPERARGDQLRLLRRIAHGELKVGDGRLGWDERKQKWMLSLAWTGPIEVREQTKIAGVDLGQIVEVNIGYIDEAGEKYKTKDFVTFPEATLRTWDRIRKQYRERQFSEREPGDKLSRVVSTGIQQLAARVVQVVKQRRCGVLVLEDLRGFASDMFDETADMPQRRRAAYRAQWLRWHYGAVREQICSAALREGLKVIVVAPGYTTMLCSECGNVWLGSEPDAKRQKAAARNLAKLSGSVKHGNEVVQCEAEVAVDETKLLFGAHGRHTVKHYSCSCGFEDNTKLNAAWNIARRGQRLLRLEE